jgi:alanine dehydrogenase
MIIGTIKEKKKFENRVSISPEEVKNYVKSGHQVLVEKNAGLQSGFSDKLYKEAGASMSSAKDILKSVDILLKINCPSPDEAKQLKPVQWLYRSLIFKMKLTLLRFLIPKKFLPFL